MKIKLILDNIRSTYNVGAILRSADGFGVEEVIFGGVTPLFNDPALLPHLQVKLNRAIAKTALGAEKSVRCRRPSNLIEELNQLKSSGWQLVGLENNLKDQRLHSLSESGLSNLLGEKIILILGEEVSGVSAELRKLADYFIEIPMQGKKESFNVAVATGIALYGLQNLA